MLAREVRNGVYNADERNGKVVQGETYLAHRLQTSHAWSGTQKVPGLHWHRVSAVVVQEAVSVSSEESWETWVGRSVGRWSITGTREKFIQIWSNQIHKAIVIWRGEAWTEPYEPLTIAMLKNRENNDLMCGHKRGGILMNDR